MCSASALNDFGQLGSAAPELRGTWRRRSSCSTAGSLAVVDDIQRGEDALDRGCTGGCCTPPHGPDENIIDASVDQVRGHTSAGFLD